jgi:hypothetical protein
MAVPHYTYLVLKIPGPKGIITVKGITHKMAQNFGMIANYGEPKEKAKSTTTEVDKLPEGHPAEPEMKKP